MIKNFFRSIIVLLFILSSSNLFAQDVDSRSPKPVPSNSKQAAADKKKEKQKQKAEKDVEAGKKRHEKLQAKNTRKMMKKSKRTSKKWNDGRK
jgi:hypothetical protein